MKLLITSNILIGLNFPHLACAANQLREARHDALREIISLAEHEKVDALFLLGNTLADNRISHHDIHEVANTLSRSEVPVYVLPGHKDPYTPDSPYRYLGDGFTGKVIILGRSKPFKIEGYTFYPCPVRSRDRQIESDFDLIKTTHEEKSVALVSHVEDPGKFSLEIQAKGLSGVLCGGQFESFAKGSILTAGCSENTDFDQPEASVGLVNIDEQLFTLQPKKMNRIYWRKFEYHSAALQSLPEDIGKLSNLDSTLLKVEVHGDLPVDDFLEVEAILEQVEERCIYLQRDLEIKLYFPKTANPLLAQIVSDITEQLEQSTAVDEPFSPIPSDEEIFRYAQLYLYKLINQSNTRDFK